MNYRITELTPIDKRTHTLFFPEVEVTYEKKVSFWKKKETVTEWRQFYNFFYEHTEIKDPKKVYLFFDKYVQFESFSEAKTWLTDYESFKNKTDEKLRSIILCSAGAVETPKIHNL